MLILLAFPHHCLRAAPGLEDLPQGRPVPAQGDGKPAGTVEAPSEMAGLCRFWMPAHPAKCWRRWRRWRRRSARWCAARPPGAGGVGDRRAGAQLDHLVRRPSAGGTGEAAQGTRTAARSTTLRPVLAAAVPAIAALVRSSTTWCAGLALVALARPRRALERRPGRPHSGRCWRSPRWCATRPPGAAGRIAKENATRPAYRTSACARPSRF